MPAAGKLTFRAERRLRRRKEYEEVYRARNRVTAKNFVIQFRANDLGFDRLGLSVSGKFGSSVKRNRAKRITRELFRTEEPASGPQADLIVTPKQQILETDWEELQRDWRSAIERIRKQLRRQE